MKRKTLKGRGEDLSKRDFLVQVAQYLAQSLPVTRRTLRLAIRDIQPDSVPEESNMIGDGRIPKRQRCNHEVKNRLQLNPTSPKTVAKRFQLLAYVV